MNLRNFEFSMKKRNNRLVSIRFICFVWENLVDDITLGLENGVSWWKKLYFFYI